jgi:hypothetical protein
VAGGEKGFSSVKSGHQLLIISFSRPVLLHCDSVCLLAPLCFAPFKFGTHTIKYTSLLLPLIHISSAPCSLCAYCFPASAVCCTRKMNSPLSGRRFSSWEKVNMALFSLNFNKIPTFCAATTKDSVQLLCVCSHVNLVAPSWL